MSTKLAHELNNVDMRADVSRDEKVRTELGVVDPNILGYDVGIGYAGA